MYWLEKTEKGDNTMLKNKNIIAQLAKLLVKQDLISESERLKLLSKMKEG